MQKKSNVIFTLCSASFLATICTEIWPELIIKYWMSSFHYLEWSYWFVFFQLFTSQFIHWDFLHLLFNMIFVYIFWNYVANIIWEKLLTLFFIFSSIFIWIFLLIFSQWITIGMSGFALAILSFYSLVLYRKWDLEYKWALFAIILNIFIWFTPWISLLWHLFWAISWVIFYLIYFFYQKFNLNSSNLID